MPIIPEVKSILICRVTETTIGREGAKVSTIIYNNPDELNNYIASLLIDTNINLTTEVTSSELTKPEMQSEYQENTSQSKSSGLLEVCILIPIGIY